jgi:predicted ATP-grasp superfamily ATP-dependent carboligase
VVKPDDGAGSERTEVIPDRALAEARLEQLGPGFVAQPWQPGTAISLSLLCADGEARVLSCNRQQVRIAEGQVSLGGIVVNGEARLAPLLLGLAGQVARALPGLGGHVGVDLILGTDGPVILEINPRLTTSYCGLRRALGVNPAALVLELSRTGRLPDTPAPENCGSAELVLESADVV